MFARDPAIALGSDAAQGLRRASRASARPRRAARAAARPPRRARERRSRVGQLLLAALDLGRRPWPISRSRRLRSCARSITPATGRAKVASSTTTWQRLRGAGRRGRSRSRRARQPPDRVAVALQPGARGGGGVPLLQRQPGRGRHVELAARGADGADQRGPASRARPRPRRSTSPSAELRPARRDQQAAGRAERRCHSSSVTNGAIGCSRCRGCASTQAAVPRVSACAGRVVAERAAAWPARRTSRRTCPRGSGRARAPRR